MNNPEIIFNEVMVAQAAMEFQIKAGTYCVLPTLWCDAPLAEEEVEWEYPTPPFPDFLLICEGQSLKRELYPGWSAALPGGFYDFNLPNLRDAFILGFNEDGEPIKGSGCVYFRDVPEILTPPRHQQILD
jgi:hypothetical protein